MKLKSLHDLFADELRDLYSAENQITKALPKMAKAASSPELRQAFEFLQPYVGHKRLTKVQPFELLQPFEMDQCSVGRSPAEPDI